MANTSVKMSDGNQGDKRAEKDIVVYMMQPNGQLVEMSEEFKNQVVQWVIDLSDEKTRETALLELSKRREQIPELAVWLWHSFGCMAALLQETVNTYIYMDPATLTAHQSNRVCNALALLQCVASHKETRKYFLDARIPLFLYPFLANRQTVRPFEYLRLTSLGVIGALVKTDDPDVIVYLLTGENSEIIPLCLKIMEGGSELSKTVATFIIQKILWDDKGLNYICQTFQRFTHVATVLKNMVENFEVPGENPTAAKKNQIQNQATAAGRLLKHILRCYLRFSEHAKAKDSLAQPKLFPTKLLDSSLLALFREDKSSVLWLAQICNNINVTSEIVQQLGAGIIPVAAATTSAAGPNPITSPESHFMLGNLGSQTSIGGPQQQQFGATTKGDMQMGGSGIQSQQLVQSPSLMPTISTTTAATGAMHGGNALNMAGNMRTSPNLVQMPPGSGITSSGFSLSMPPTSAMGPSTLTHAGASGQQIGRSGPGGMPMFGSGGHQSQLHGGMGVHNMNNMGPPSLFAGAGGFVGAQQGGGNTVTPGLPPTHLHRHGAGM